MVNNGKNSVLIVDDEKINLEILNKILEPEYTVYMTKSGLSAIQMANDISPDLIFLDILLPDMNGFDVLSVIKNTKKTRNIPVIIITGLENAEDEEKGLNLEAADYIRKPFSSKIVKLKVRNQIQLVNHLSELIELHKQLETAVIDAKTANKAKSSFLARMSHEIRTPLNAVLGISEMQLQNKTLAQDVKEAFTKIYNSGDLLLGIINDILDISKIEAGKLELIQEKYHVSSMINDTVYLNIIKYEDKGIKFILNVDENVPSQLIGDEIRIKQILNNLLSNAFKYTAAGEVEFSVNAEADADSSNFITLVFRVRDTGQGLTEEQLDTLFDDYSRFNLEINRTNTGTGLGMGITRNLIHMMNGELLAESKKDKGSLFTVRIPQGNINAPVLGKETAEKLRHFRGNFESKVRNTNVMREMIPSGKILIVDDNDMNLYVAKEMLSPYKLQIDTALNGAMAIEKIKKSCADGDMYDIVFMDHMMPVMDGIEATNIIRKMGAEYEKLPVIALTANSIAGMEEIFLSNGFNGFISKPINIQELDFVLKKWISSDKFSKTGKITGNEDEKINDNFLDILGSMQEINTAAGLNNVSGNIDLYRSSLEIFYNKIEPECGNMKDLLDNKEIKKFLISIHAMKAMLAIIGATELIKEARELEIASLNQDIDYCTQNYNGFKDNLLLIREKLSPLFSARVTSPQDAESADIETKNEQKTKKILLVDDMDMILFVVKEKIERLGFQVDTATRGREAIEKIINNEYDIVFMDYLMPEMNGIETTNSQMGK